MVIETTRCEGEVTSPYNSVGWPFVAARGPDNGVPKTAPSCVGVTGALTPATLVTAGPGDTKGGTVGAGPESLGPSPGDDLPDECPLQATSPSAMLATANAGLVRTE